MVAFPSWLLTPQVILGRSAFPRGVLVRADVYRSGGLDPTGGSNSGCSSSTGQVYARAGAYSGKFGIMYSWYMPKDSPSSGLGHRHDWENIVVWLSAQSTSATITGVAISAHGGYQKDSSPGLQGTSPKIGYISYFPVNHQLIATNELGGQQPLIAWDSMTAAARTAIENTVSDTLKCLRGLAKAALGLRLCDPQLQGQQLPKLPGGCFILRLRLLWPDPTVQVSSPYELAPCTGQQDLRTMNMLTPTRVISLSKLRQNQ